MTTDNENICRLERRPVKQAPHYLPSNQSRIEQLATGKSTSTKGKRTITVTEKLKIAKDRVIVGIWNVPIQRATGKLELLRNTTKWFEHDIVGILEVGRTGNGETLDRDFI